MKYIVIVKNQSTQDCFIDDLGITIYSSSEITLTDLYDFYSIMASKDLKTFVNDSNLIINNGIEDLDIDRALNYLYFGNYDLLKNNYYTKDELESGEGININYDGIINKPFHKSVKCRISGIFSSHPVPTTNQQIYVNSTNSKYYKYDFDTDSWVFLDMVVDNHRVIDLNDSFQIIKEYKSGEWVTAETINNGDVVIVKNNGNGKPSQYIYSVSKWKFFKTIDNSKEFVHIFDSEGGQNVNTASAVRFKYDKISFINKDIFDFTDGKIVFKKPGDYDVNYSISFFNSHTVYCQYSNRRTIIVESRCRGSQSFPLSVSYSMFNNKAKFLLLDIKMNDFIYISVKRVGHSGIRRSNRNSSWLTVQKRQE